jgi:hypothetical protein
MWKTGAKNSHAQSARFCFGRLQAQHFLRRIGCHALIRGHEKIN